MSWPRSGWEPTFWLLEKGDLQCSYSLGPCLELYETRAGDYLTNSSHRGHLYHKFGQDMSEASANYVRAIYVAMQEDMLHKNTCAYRVRANCEKLELTKPSTHKGTCSSRSRQKP